MDKEHVVATIDAAIANKARIRVISAEGNGQSSRDVDLTGLSVEDSRYILEAVRDVIAGPPPEEK